MSPNELRPLGLHQYLKVANRVHYDNIPEDVLKQSL